MVEKVKAWCERKPDDVKREIIATIAQNLEQCCFGYELSQLPMWL